MKKFIIFCVSFYWMMSIGLFGENDKKQECSDNSNFVLSKKQTKKIKNMSKDALKEHLGESTRDAFHHTTELSKQVGTLQVMCASNKKSKEKVEQEASLLQASLTMHEKVGTFQVELATLQKRFSTVIEQLIDNQAPFKKAGKSVLQSAYTIMMRVGQDLKQHVTTCTQLCEKLKTEKEQSSLKTMQCVAQSFQSCNSSLKKLVVQLDEHECLKRV